jgi:hypothetical protein
MISVEPLRKLKESIPARHEPAKDEKGSHAKVISYRGRKFFCFKFVIPAKAGIQKFHAEEAGCPL